MGEKVQGLKSTNWHLQNRQRDTKNSVGNGVAKDLICRTHGHELRGGGTAGQNGVSGREGHRGKMGQL